MKIYCPECGAAVAAQNLNIDKLLAKCGGCGNVFSFDKVADSEREQSQRRLGPPAAALPRPRRIEVREGAGMWSATWRWFQPAHFFLIFFCIAWDGFLIFWYSIAFATHGPLMMKVFPVAHVAVGVGLTYFTLCGFLNRTIVEMTRSELSIRHGPLPWRGNRMVSPAQIERVYDEERRTGSRNGNPSYSYGVFAHMADGTKLPLISSLPNADEAKFLAQQIGQQLRMP